MTVNFGWTAERVLDNFMDSHEALMPSHRSNRDTQEKEMKIRGSGFCGFDGSFDGGKTWTRLETNQLTKHRTESSPQPRKEYQPKRVSRSTRRPASAPGPRGGRSSDANRSQQSNWRKDSLATSPIHLQDKPPVWPEPGSTRLKRQVPHPGAPQPPSPYVLLTERRGMLVKHRAVPRLLRAPSSSSKPRPQSSGARSRPQFHDKVRDWRAESGGRMPCYYKDAPK